MPGVLGEALVEHPLQLSEHLVRHAAARELRSGVLQNRVERLDGARAFEGRLTAEQLEQQAPVAEDVGAWIDFLATHLLGRHVGGGSDESAGIGVAERRCLRAAVHYPRSFEHLGETEIDHLRVTRRGDHHVRRLEVAVHDAVAVGLGQLDRDT